MFWMLVSKVVCRMSASLFSGVVGVGYGLVWASLPDPMMLDGGVYIWNS